MHFFFNLYTYFNLVKSVYAKKLTISRAEVMSLRCIVDFQCRSYAAANAFVSHSFSHLAPSCRDLAMLRSKIEYNVAAKWNHNLPSERDDRRKESIYWLYILDTIVRHKIVDRGTRVPNRCSRPDVLSRRSPAEKSDLSAS